MLHNFKHNKIYIHHWGLLQDICCCRIWCIYRSFTVFMSNCLPARTVLIITRGRRPRANPPPPPRTHKKQLYRRIKLVRTKYNMLKNYGYKFQVIILNLFYLTFDFFFLILTMISSDKITKFDGICWVNYFLNWV